jgi:hypothetical protein
VPNRFRIALNVFTHTPFKSIWRLTSMLQLAERFSSVAFCLWASNRHGFFTKLYSTLTDSLQNPPQAQRTFLVPLMCAAINLEMRIGVQGHDKSRNNILR